MVMSHIHNKCEDTGLTREEFSEQKFLKESFHVEVQFLGLDNSLFFKIFDCFVYNKISLS